MAQKRRHFVISSQSSSNPMAAPPFYNRITQSLFIVPHHFSTARVFLFLSDRLRFCTLISLSGHDCSHIDVSIFPLLGRSPLFSSPPLPFCSLRLFPRAQCNAAGIFGTFLLVPCVINIRPSSSLRHPPSCFCATPHVGCIRSHTLSLFLSRWYSALSLETKTCSSSPFCRSFVLFLFSSFPSSEPDRTPLLRCRAHQAAQPLRSGPASVPLRVFS